MTGMEADHHERRQERRRKTAEDFTPTWLVNQMLDKLPESTWADGKTFLDPTCGNGNMLVCVLQRKLSLGHDPLQALQATFGADLMADNVKETRLRLLKVVSKQARVTKEMIRTVFTNVVCTKAYPSGSLGYDFSFPPTTAEKSIDHWRKNIKDMLEKVGDEGLTEDVEDSEDEKEDEDIPFELSPPKDN